MPTPEASSVLVTVLVNGQRHDLPAGEDLATLLARLGHAADAVATAVNGDLVPRSLRARHRLRAGDQVSCFQPIVGG